MCQCIFCCCCSCCVFFFFKPETRGLPTEIYRSFLVHFLFTDWSVYLYPRSSVSLERMTVKRFSSQSGHRNFGKRGAALGEDSDLEEKLGSDVIIWLVSDLLL